MNRIRHSAMNVLPVFAILFATIAVGDDEPPKNNSAAKALQKQYLADAEEYEFFADADQQTRFEFVPKPVMHWASHDDWSGDLFVWSHRGRPEIIGCMLSGPDPAGRIFFHEFHALTLGKLPTQKLTGGRTWSLEQPAIELKPLDKAPTPADSEKARLTQMRAISREFAVHMHAGEQPWELRLLPQPIVRYQRPSDETEWLDGAVFTYVWTTGTDAEVLLILEARKQDGEFRWHYSPARITNREVWMHHGDKEIWRVPAHTEQGLQVTRPYTTFYSRTEKVAAQ